MLTKRHLVIIFQRIFSADVNADVKVLAFRMQSWVSESKGFGRKHCIGKYTSNDHLDISFMLTASQWERDLSD
jgi:hypothetical protein